MACLLSDSICCLCAGKLTLSLSQQAAAWAESREHAEVLVMVGGRLLIDWLLATAAREDNGPEQANAERALLSLVHCRALPMPHAPRAACTLRLPQHPL